MKPTLGSLRRRFTTLLTSLIFAVLAITGVLAFVRPFSIQVVGLHALTGLVFIALAGFHVVNNIRPLKRYLRSRVVWATLLITVALTGIILLQPRPVRALLGLSANMGPALDRFEMREDGLVFYYSPDSKYKMQLTIKTGAGFDPEDPPRIAIWLENQSFYHIKTLHKPEQGDREKMLPYWAYKVREYEKAKRKADETGDVLAISEPTRNSSFDPADYILPADIENPMPYQLLIEINQLGDAHEAVDDQPSLVYSVNIDNLYPKTFQLLELVGYPKRNDSDGGEVWSVYYVDEEFGSALNLIDSALLKIERSEP